MVFCFDQWWKSRLSIEYPLLCLDMGTWSLFNGKQMVSATLNIFLNMCNFHSDHQFQPGSSERGVNEFKYRVDSTLSTDWYFPAPKEEECKCLETHSGENN